MNARPEPEERGDGWTLWANERPADTKAAYRWRVPARKICGLVLRPEWSAKLVLVGMGYADNEWWPPFSHWDGYQRTVPHGLEWRLASDDEKAVRWVGLDLLPCPFTEREPTVEYHGRWIGAPPYEAQWLSISSYLVRSNGWKSAQEMQDAWNRRPSPHRRGAP